MRDKVFTFEQLSKSVDEQTDTRNNSLFPGSFMWVMYPYDKWALQNHTGWSNNHGYLNGWRVVTSYEWSRLPVLVKIPDTYDSYPKVDTTTENR